MRCACCDRVLGPTEVSWNTECDQWEYCGTCLVEIADVFGDGDHLSEEEIDGQLELEFPEFPDYPDENDATETDPG